MRLLVFALHVPWYNGIRGDVPAGRGRQRLHELGTDRPTQSKLRDEMSQAGNILGALVRDQWKHKVTFHLHVRIP